MHSDQSPRSTRVMVVDDEPHIARLMQFLLQRAGYEVTIAGTGEQALQILAGNDIDAVLLDLVLPGISGLDVLRALRSDPRWAQTPVLVLSARSEPEGWQDVIDAGATAYCPKPVSPPVLLSKLNDIGAPPAIG